MRRWIFVIAVSFGLFIALAINTKAVRAAEPYEPDGPTSRDTRARYACVPSLIWRSPELCPSYGPGATAYRIASIRLPNPLPALPVSEIPRDEDDELVPYTYAYVKALPLNVYRHPMEAAMGLPPVRTMFSGDWWVSIDGEVNYEGQKWYQINRDEFILADAVVFATPYPFKGV
jgi:hypothetical protein